MPILTERSTETSGAPHVLKLAPEQSGEKLIPLECHYFMFHLLKRTLTAYENIISFLHKSYLVNSIFLQHEVVEP